MGDLQNLSSSAYGPNRTYPAPNYSQPSGLGFSTQPISRMPSDGSPSTQPTNSPIVIPPATSWSTIPGITPGGPQPAAASVQLSPGGGPTYQPTPPGANAPTNTQTYFTQMNGRTYNGNIPVTLTSSLNLPAASDVASMPPDQQKQIYQQIYQRIQQLGSNGYSYNNNAGGNDQWMGDSAGLDLLMQIDPAAANLYQSFNGDGTFRQPGSSPDNSGVSYGNFGQSAGGGSGSDSYGAGGSGGSYSSVDSFNPATSSDPSMSIISSLLNNIFGGSGGGGGGGGISSVSTSTTSPGITQLSSSLLNGNIYSAPQSSSDYSGLRSFLQQFLTNNASGINAQAPQISGTYGTGIPTLNRGQISNVNATPVSANGTDIPTISRNQIGNVSSTPVSSAGTDIQSVDQLGGANSAFFQNMVNSLSPAFADQRAKAIAQAKESVGSLTGSGLANSIGNSVNQSLSAEQAALAQYASQGVTQELQREGQLSSQANTRNLADASNSQAAQTSNQGADVNFLSQMLARAGQLSSQANNRNITDANNTQAAATSNQNADLSFIQQLLAQGGQTLAGQQLGLSQAQSNQSAATQTANDNASRIASLLGATGTAGVAPNQIISQSGLAALLGPLASALGSSSLGSGLASGLGSLASGLGSLGSGLVGSLGSLGGSLASGLGSLGSGLTSGLGSLGGLLGSGLGALGQGLGGLTGGLGNAFSNMDLGSITDVVKSALGGLGNLDFSGIANTLKSLPGVGDIVNKIITGAGNINLSSITDALKKYGVNAGNVYGLMQQLAKAGVIRGTGGQVLGGSGSGGVDYGKLLQQLLGSLLGGGNKVPTPGGINFGL